MPLKNKCLIAFFNTTSGRFKWWDEFPIEIRNQLASKGIDSYYFYKSKSDRSLYSKNDIFINPELIGDGSLNDEKWLSENVWPIMERYQKVIIHTHSYYPPFKFRKLIRKHGKTTWVETIHRCPLSNDSRLLQFYKQILRRLKILPDWYIGVSNATTRYIAKTFGEANTLTIHNGIDLPKSADRKNPGSSSETAKKRYLFINRLDKGKGVEILVEALPVILERDSKFHLTIAGDGPLRYLVEQILQKMKAPNLCYVGHSSNVEGLYSTHDVLLMPYTRPQGLSLISLEARSYGLPAVYTAMGGVVETRDSTNGVIMKNATAASLVEAVLQVDTATNISNLIAGCYEGLDYYGIQRMATEYCEFYGDLWG